MKVAIIGAGPSGLSTLKYLITAHEYFPMKPIEARLFEAEEKIGGTFTHRTYEDAVMVSSKYLTAFSDFRFAREEAEFVPTARYVQYLNDYATHFDLWPHMQLSTRVLKVMRAAGEKHTIYYQKNGSDTVEEWECDAVAVCSGLHVLPHVPHIPGIEHVPTVMHSSEFKERKQFGKDTTVMVLGAGETAFDIGYLAVTSPTKRVILCHRDGWLNAAVNMPEVDFFPTTLSTKNINRWPHTLVPIDTGSGSLFDTMYLHPKMRDSNIVWNHYHTLTQVGSWMISGRLCGVDQWNGYKDMKKFHMCNTVVNKSTRIVPYLNKTYRTTGKGSLVERIRHFFMQIPWVEPADGRHVDVAPWVSEFTPDGVARFVKSKEPMNAVEYERIKDEVIKPDVVILCTGYRQEFALFDAQNAAAAKAANLREPGRLVPWTEQPYPTPDEADVRRMWRRGDPTIGFIGFVRPALGAIPPLGELQGMLWVMTLCQRKGVEIPRLYKPLRISREDQAHYKLQKPDTARVQYSVDQEAYAYQLGCDIQGCPSFTEVLAMSYALGYTEGRKLLKSWAFGSNMNPKFRLRGPWKWDGASPIMRGEINDVIERRSGMFNNYTMAVVPAINLGTCSLLFFLYYEVFLGFFRLLARAIGLGPEPKVDMEHDD